MSNDAKTMALGDPQGTTVTVKAKPAEICIRITGEVGVGKTGVAKVIQDALLETYGDSVTVDIALTDIKSDTNSRDELVHPIQGSHIKIIEDIKSR